MYITIDRIHMLSSRKWKYKCIHSFILLTDTQTWDVSNVSNAYQYKSTVTFICIIKPLFAVEKTLYYYNICYIIQKQWPTDPIQKEE